MKIKLILQPEQFTSFTSWYLEPLWHQYFDIEVHDPTKTYDKSALFVFWWMNADGPLVHKLHEQGYKIVIDNLWEIRNAKFDQYYQLNNQNWWWWNESLWWRALGYDQYIPEKTYKKIALMPIRRLSTTRDTIVKKMQPYLDQMLWSYRDQHLPNDEYPGESADINQRFMNPKWYNDTCINLVVESVQIGTGLIVSEKTYKSCAFYHPMLIIGQSGALEFIKQQGFETFDNMFDESYDQETDFEKRLHMVVENLNQVSKESYSDLTWAKLKHNHDHFFNQQLCEQKIMEEIIQPLLEYAETR
jgi:hypothetical protein